MPDVGRVYVIEPHADDAFLSLGGHIEGWVKAGLPVTIVTVFSGTRHRGRDAALYAEAVRADWVGLGYVEAEGSRLAGPDPAVAQADFAPLHFRGIGDRHGELTIWPLGVRHPDHRAVAAAAPPDEPRYVEVPYSLVNKNAPEVVSLVTGKELLSLWSPPARKWRHCGVFRDQSKFFHYNPPERLARSMEVVVR